MNPIELSVVIISSVLVTLLLVFFLRDLMLISHNAIDEFDLTNVLLVYKKGVSNGVSFSVNYKTLNNGSLKVTDDFISFNNASRENQGFLLNDCFYDSILINGSGVFCLRS